MFEVEVIEVGVERTRERLAPCDQCASPSPPVPVILFLFGIFIGFFLDMRLDDLLHISNLDQDILRLQIRVDDSTLAVEIVQAQQYLLCNLLD